MHLSICGIPRSWEMNLLLRVPRQKIFSIFFLLSCESSRWDKIEAQCNFTVGVTKFINGDFSLITDAAAVFFLCTTQIIATFAREIFNYSHRFQNLHLFKRYFILRVLTSFGCKKEKKRWIFASFWVLNCIISPLTFLKKFYEKIQLWFSVCLPPKKF